MFIDYRNSSSKLNPRFALYLKDLFNHHKVLSPEVENALITKAKKDDDLEAKNLIILSHCRLYYRVSCKYAFYVQGSISQTEDFFNECFIAANKALDTYQIGRSKFSTWVLFYIKRQFIKYINENSRTITYPVSVYYASKRMENQEKAGKIFKEVDATEYKKSFFEAIFMQNVIFDNNNESSIMYKSIVSENDEKESLKNLDFVLGKYLDKLSIREKDFIIKYFGIGNQKEESIKNLSKINKISTQAIYKIIHRGIKKLQYNASQLNKELVEC